MKNNKGSILVLTVCFILVFTMLGLAVIYMAGAQNEAAEKRKFSTGGVLFG